MDGFGIQNLLASCSARIVHETRYHSICRAPRIIEQSIVVRFQYFHVYLLPATVCLKIRISMFVLQRKAQRRANSSGALNANRDLNQESTSSNLRRQT